MKQVQKRILLLLSSLALALAFVMLCACGGGEKQYTLTLDPDGGTLSSSTLTLKEGENVFDAVKDLVPSKDGYEFTGWYEGDSPLAEDRTMTGDLSLKAHYSEEAKPAAGRIVYNRNVPLGCTVTGRVLDTLAGADGKATVADGAFEAVGCRFLGWSTSDNGPVTHLPGQEVVPEGTLYLYAVWQRGLSDRFGGNDYIFDDGDRAILQRGGVEFDGTLEGDIFTFETPSGAVKGKIFPQSNSFCFAQERFAGRFVFNSAYDGRTDSTDVLTLDEYGTGTHSYTENGAAVSDSGYIVPGPVTIDNESGEVMSVQYIFRIDSGVNAGTEFGFRLAQAGGQRVFQSTFGEAGYYVQYRTPDGVTFFAGGCDITLDGFGSAVFAYADSVNYIPFNGTYTVLGWTNSNGYPLYRIDAKLQDTNDLAGRLGYDVKDGCFSLSFYTIPLQGDMYAYVEPSAEAGEYSIEGGGSLTLDGFFQFMDSAVYTDAQGVRHAGMYAISETPEYDWLITLTIPDENGVPTNERYSFRIALRGTEGDTATFFRAEEVPMEYLHLAPGVFDYDVVLAVSYDIDESIGGYRAQLLRQTKSGSSQYTVAAEGYVSAQALTGGNFNLFTYHETNHLLSDAELPTSFVFLTGSAYDNNFITHDIYYVFEYTYQRDGAEVTEKQYIEVTDEEGSGDKIWYLDLGFGGVGAIYFTGNTAYVGGFSVDTASYYMGPVGTFVWTDAKNVQEVYYFDVQIGDGTATFREIGELEYPVLTGNADGSVDGETVRLLVRGDEALYSPDGSFGDGSVRGTLRYVGTNIFDEDLVQLVDDSGAVRLSFLFAFDNVEIPITPYFSYYEENWVYYTLNEAVAGTYTSNGETLIVDGYHKARYKDARGVETDGTYTYRSQDGVLSFKPAILGQFRLGQDKTFTHLDGAYGNMELFYRNRWFTVSFDGLGNLTVKMAQQTVGSGIYEIDDLTASVFELFISFDEPYSEFLDAQATIRVAPGSAGLVVIDADLANVFIGQDWSVLRLDGHGGGSYYNAADGSASQIYYDTISAEDGYLHLRGTDTNVLVNKTEKTFSYPVSAEHILFYGSNFSALEFGTGGMLYTDTNTCYYLIDGNKTVLYLSEQFSEYYERIVVNGTPSRNANFTVNDTVYYPYKAGESVTFTGTVDLKDDEAGIDVSYDATLTFTPDGNLQFEFGAVRGEFTVGNDRYNVYVINSYNGADGHNGLSLYDPNTYEYSPFGEYEYNPDGQSTFHVKGGKTDTVLYDGSEGVTVPDEQSSRLTESHVGFGPIVLSDTVLSGVVHAGNETFTFSNAKPILVQNAGGTDVRYMATFTQNGETYAIYYIKEGGYYRLYMLATYSEREADGYTVGVGAFYYSNGYEFPDHVKQGTPFAITLYEGTGESKTPIVAFNQFVNFDGQSGWVLALGGYDPQTDRGSLGSIYTVTFGQDCSVKAYTVKQAVGTIEGASAAANFCLDEEGNVVAVASIMRDSGDGSYEFYYFTTVEKEGDNTWVFHSAEGIDDVAITLVTDENGGYVEDGEYWSIECEYRDHAE